MPKSAWEDETKMQVTYQPEDRETSLIFVTESLKKFGVNEFIMDLTHKERKRLIEILLAHHEQAEG